MAETSHCREALAINHVCARVTTAFSEGVRRNVLANQTTVSPGPRDQRHHLFGDPAEVEDMTTRCALLNRASDGYLREVSPQWTPGPRGPHGRAI